MAKISTTVDTRFDVVDDLLDGFKATDDQMPRIDARLARLLSGDEVLRTIRIKCGIAQKAIAADLGVTASAIAQLEARSLDTVQLGTIRRYFEALGYQLTIGLGPIDASRRPVSR